MLILSLLPPPTPSVFLLGKFSFFAPNIEFLCIAYWAVRIYAYSAKRLSDASSSGQLKDKDGTDIRHWCLAGAGISGRITDKWPNNGCLVEYQVLGAKQYPGYLAMVGHQIKYQDGSQISRRISGLISSIFIQTK